MNIIQQLTEQQETNRIDKGYQIYLQNLIEHDHINPRLYVVKGKYQVEELTMEGDIEPSYICSCNDYKYRGVLCGHILAVTFYQLNNNGA